MDREITKKIVTAGIGLAFTIISHLVIKKGNVAGRIDEFYDAREAKKED